VRSAAVGQIVAVNRRDNRVGQVKLSHSFGDVARLF
jgi:hypothetical protein